MKKLIVVLLLGLAVSFTQAAETAESKILIVKAIKGTTPINGLTDAQAVYASEHTRWFVAEAGVYFIVPILKTIPAK